MFLDRELHLSPKSQGLFLSHRLFVEEASLLLFILCTFFFLCSFIWPCLRLTRVEQMAGNSQELEIAQSNGTRQDFLKSVMLVVQAMTSLQNSKTAIRIWTLKETAIMLITVNYIDLLEL